MSEKTAQTQTAVSRELFRRNLTRLLDLQQIDLQVEKDRECEIEIPKQKRKFDADRKRLQAELEEQEARCQALKLEQKDAEGEIEQMRQQIGKYEQQLLAVKKNDEYQALLHEIDALKKKIDVKEERILNVMDELDEAQARLQEDEKRIKNEEAELDRQCKLIDEELAEAVAEREQLEAKRAPLEEEIDNELMKKYVRIRKSKRTGAAVVPLSGEFCAGCNMAIRAQSINEILAGVKIHICPHCGRILYNPEDLAADDGAAN